jgi:hypothetical protein
VLAPSPPAAVASYLQSLLPAPAAQPTATTEAASADEPRTEAASDSAAAAAATPDLRPRGLQVSQPEVEFLARLGPLLPTPRAAKRLVNLYRLVRISIPEPDLATFAGAGDGPGEFQVVQILLAILVGRPALAQRVFEEIMAAPADSDIRTLLAKPAAESTIANGMGACARISAVLDQAVADLSLRTGAAAYQPWCPRLARYSFHTRELAAGLSTGPVVRPGQPEHPG